ncbi:Uncharacterized protein APZ42_032092 [Daphnia magna]|uniref:Uncharacterized protein n=1 Tax=Daphnia magna TaxID=35525 RepID=A0A164MAA2_9CRUS|nr:Uncharacterized protein APZ42_032092 [Daphnia magna]
MVNQKVELLNYRLTIKCTLIFSAFPTLRNACDPAKAETEWGSSSLTSTDELGLQTEYELRLLSAATF